MYLRKQTGEITQIIVVCALFVTRTRYIHTFLEKLK